MKRKILQIILGSITKRIIKKYNPKVIAVTGSVGKTSTKNAIAIFLEKYFSVRKSAGNLNSEFGVPLVFIGKEKGGEGCFFEWLKIIFSGIRLIAFKKSKYPEIIVAEMGADKPGDIAYLLKTAKADIGVITWIGETPVHLQNYKNIEELVLEKSRIIKSLGGSNFAILNFDDPRVRMMKKGTKSQVIYFGFEEGADIRIDNLKNKFKVNRDREIPFGIIFDIYYKGSKTTIHLPCCFGKSSAYSVGAALACGAALGIDFGRAPDIFRDLEAEKGRMNLIEGKNGSLVIDDTYNSSPASAKAALETMASFPAERRIAVLGDMKELGAVSLKAHEEMGGLAFGTCDILITIGKEAERIKEKALDLGFHPKRAFHFQDPKDIVSKLKDILNPGDLVLIKGSRSMRMEKIVEEIAEKSE